MKDFPKSISTEIHRSLNGVEESYRQAIEERIRTFGKSQKAAGARSFASLVKEMRRNQKMYFQSRSSESLADSKRLEQQVDRSIEAIEKYQKVEADL